MSGGEFGIVSQRAGDVEHRSAAGFGAFELGFRLALGGLDGQRLQSWFREAHGVLLHRGGALLKRGQDRAIEVQRTKLIRLSRVLRCSVRGMEMRRWLVSRGSL